MLKGMKKHEEKEQGETIKHEAISSINHKATGNKNKTGTTALERSVAKTTGGLKIFLTSPWVPIYFLIQKYIKSSVRTLTRPIYAP